jgi:hypothetical protein
MTDDPYHVALEEVASQEGQPPAFRRLATLLDDAHLLGHGLDEIYEELYQLGEYKDHLEGLYEVSVLADLTVSAAHRAVDELILPRCLDKALGRPVQRLRSRIWDEWNALPEPVQARVKTIAERLGLEPAEVAAVVFPPELRD